MSFLDYLEELRAKPEHTRRQIALSTAGAFTLVVALGWVAAFATNGTLALENSPAIPAPAVAKEDFTNLLGAANAFQQNMQDASGVSVVETASSSTLDTETVNQDATVIPF